MIDVLPVLVELGSQLTLFQDQLTSPAVALQDQLSRVFGGLL